MHSRLKQHVSEIISLNEAEIAEFLSLFTEKTVKKRSILISPNEKVTEEYYVVKGCLKAYYLDEHGEKHIIQFAIEDWWISDFEAFFTQQKSKLYIEAIEDSKLLGINFNNLQILYTRIPKFERFFRIKTTAAFIAQRKRILSSLEKSATRRYLDFCNAYPSIEKRVANYHIANYLGVKPESLSRIRKKIGHLT